MVTNHRDYQFYLAIAYNMCTKRWNYVLNKIMNPTLNLTISDSTILALTKTALSVDKCCGA